jgi:FixJ family two-component response regulator
MAEGTPFGRKPKLTKHQAREALKRVAAGEPLREIALSFNVDHSTSRGSRHATWPRFDPGSLRNWCENRSELARLGCILIRYPTLGDGR